MSDQIAILSDIHGNTWALQTVLENIQTRGVKTILNLGDSLYGPLDPTGTADLLMQIPDLISISGNQDRVLLEEPPNEISVTLRQNLEGLTPGHRIWLKNQPPTLVYQNIFFLCHGTPQSDDTALLHRITPNGAKPRSTDEIKSMLNEVTQPIILCGHDHKPSIRATVEKLILNPGSVGLPAYIDEEPFPHVMETGEPHARYMILNQNEEGLWEIETIRLDYDWATAAQTAERNQRPDWAHWLRTGRANFEKQDLH